jgi:hypothetical protein
MTEMLIEAVFMAFMIGGIVGAAIVLSLKSSRLWGRQDDEDAVELTPVRARTTRRYRR